MLALVSQVQAFQAPALRAPATKPAATRMAVVCVANSVIAVSSDPSSRGCAAAWPYSFAKSTIVANR